MEGLTFLKELLQDPIVIHIGIRDEQGLLYQTMFFGADMSDESNILKLFIPETALARIRYLLQAGTHASVLATSAETYQCVQAKGRLLAIHPANLGEEAIQSLMLQRLVPFNYPEKLFNMKHLPLLTLDLEIDEIFNQTPGEQAGERLEF